jgi:uncharacterized protein with HEPN domain
MWRDEAYLLDMLLAARKVLRFTAGVDQVRFLADEMMQDAVMRQIQIVGEAARKLSPEWKEAHGKIPWPAIIGMRHRLVHEYVSIIPEMVWEVVATDLPALILQLEPLVPPDRE